MSTPNTTNLMSYQLGYWAKCFASHNQFQAFTLDEDTLSFCDKNNRKHTISPLSIHSQIAVESGWFWDVLVVNFENGQNIRFGGVSKEQSTQILQLLNQFAANHIERFYQQFSPALKQAAQEARLFFSGKQYIRYCITEQWLDRHLWLEPGIKRHDCLSHLSADVHQDYLHVRSLLENRHQQTASINQAFVEQQTRLFQAFFEQVETNPLTVQQRNACVIDEQHNLVLAGAGTGKTSTMIGRAGYLINAGLAKPEQILMLAFARKAAEEMSERIQAKLGVPNLTVKTFHSLGKHIISQVEGVVPAIDKMAEDDALRVAFVDQLIQHLLADNLYRSRLLTYFLRFTYPYKSQFNFNSLGAYNTYILENDIRTLQGDLVKSYEECEIANFLYRQGVVYQYEANYQINTSGPDYRIYQPDFYLPEYGIYIEHFAVNEHNQTPPFIDQQTYLAGMAWKRALHQKYQTPLIETYSFLKQ